MQAPLMHSNIPPIRSWTDVNFDSPIWTAPINSSSSPVQANTASKILFMDFDSFRIDHALEQNLGARIPEPLFQVQPAAIDL